VPPQTQPSVSQLIEHAAVIVELIRILIPLYQRRMEQAVVAQADAPPKRVILEPHCVSAAEARGGVECPVCLCQFQCRESGVVRLKCSHVFHRECLGPWFREHHTCPVCRTDVDEGD
jgi:hypothetical protein